MNDINIPLLRFKEFSKSWEYLRLGDILTFKNGIDASKEQYGLVGYKFINVLDIINNNTIKYDDIIGSVSVIKEIFEKNKVEYGDILFQRSSETKEEAGQTNVYLDKNKPATFGGFVIRGKMIKKYQPEFMHYMLKTQHSRKEITRKSNGSTRYNVGQKTLSKVGIYLPEELEQKKIGCFLIAVDMKIKQLDNKKILLEKYKMSVIQQIFNHQIKFKDNNGFLFPNWEEKSLKTFLTLTLRKSEKPKSNYLSIGVKSHSKGTFQKPNSQPNKIASNKLYLIKENDLIVSITLAWESAIAIAKKSDENGLISHHFSIYTFNEELVIPKFFQYIISQKRFKYLLDSISPSGVGRNRVMNKKEFLNLTCSIPTLEEQYKIANFLSSIDDKINFVNTQLNKTKEFRKGLLQAMFIK